MLPNELDLDPTNVVKKGSGEGLRALIKRKKPTEPVLSRAWGKSPGNQRPTDENAQVAIMTSEKRDWVLESGYRDRKSRRVR